MCRCIGVGVLLHCRSYCTIVTALFSLSWRVLQNTRGHRQGGIDTSPREPLISADLRDRWWHFLSFILTTTLAAVNLCWFKSNVEPLFPFNCENIHSAFYRCSTLVQRLVSYRLACLTCYRTFNLYDKSRILSRMTIATRPLFSIALLISVTSGVRGALFSDDTITFNKSNLIDTSGIVGCFAFLTDGYHFFLVIPKEQWTLFPLLGSPQHTLSTCLALSLNFVERQQGPMTRAIALQIWTRGNTWKRFISLYNCTPREVSTSQRTHLSSWGPFPSTLTPISSTQPHISKRLSTLSKLSAL